MNFKSADYESTTMKATREFKHDSKERGQHKVKRKFFGYFAKDSHPCQTDSRGQWQISATKKVRQATHVLARRLRPDAIFELTSLAPNSLLFPCKEGIEGNINMSRALKLSKNGHFEPNLIDTNALVNIDT